MKQDFQHAEVPEAEWRSATEDCVALSVKAVIDETHDARSLVFEIPDGLTARFAYQPGQFLSFKIPFEGRVLTRSYSLSSSPHTDQDHKLRSGRTDRRRAGLVESYLGEVPVKQMHKLDDLLINAERGHLNIAGWVFLVLPAFVVLTARQTQALPCMDALAGT